MIASVEYVGTFPNTDRLDRVEQPSLPLSVVVPVYNEHQTIEQVVSRLSALSLLREVFLVDDGSDSETRSVLDALAERPEVSLLRHGENQGKGAALRTGFAACRGEIIAVQDADLEYRPEDIERAVRPILFGEADVVYGSRDLGDQYADAPWVRKAANRTLTRISNWSTGLRLTDMETGCKVFARRVLTGMVIEEDRFGVEPEITAKVAAAGWRVQEISIQYTPRSYREGKKIGLWDGVHALRCIARYSTRKVASIAEVLS